MKKTAIFSFTIVSFLLIGWVSLGTNPDYVSPINKTNLKANLTYLASDEVEGREAGTRGERVASGFIAAQLQKYGVQPFGDDGTYFVNFKLKINKPRTEGSLALIDKNGKTIASFLHNQDILARSNNTVPIDTTTALVFAGYGITAPEFHHDDYKGINVKNKIVLIFDNEPESSDKTFFDGPNESKYAGYLYKLKNAYEHGAKAVIMTSDYVKKYGWDRTKKRMSARSTTLSEISGKDVILPSVLIKDSVMDSILKTASISMPELVKEESSRKKLTGVELPVKAKLFVPMVEAEYQNSRNIVGIVEGTDPELKKELVAVSAHYDHVGIQREEVYNGADDDGSGTVGVLEVARVVAEKKMNKRSILIIFHAAEEKGLLGSEYLSDHFSRIKDIVSVVNMDMIGRENPDSIHVIGSDKLSTEYHNIIVAANQKTVNMTFDFKFNDPNDPNRFYYRSDHYNYAKKGIPIVFFFDDMTRDYHQASDEVQYIDFTKIQKVATLAYTIITDVSNLDHRVKVDHAIE